jgi:hypothetical protein
MQCWNSKHWSQAHDASGWFLVDIVARRFEDITRRTIMESAEPILNCGNAQVRTRALIDFMECFSKDRYVYHVVVNARVWRYRHIIHPSGSVQWLANGVPDDEDYNEHNESEEVVDTGFNEEPSTFEPP